MLEDARHLLNGDRAAIERHRRLMATGPNGEGADVADDDMGDIRIGDEVHNHYHQPPTTVSQPQAPSSGMSSLAKAGLLAAGVALGGVPAGIAAYMLSKPTPYTDNIGGLELLPPVTSEQPATVAPAVPAQP